MQRIDKVMYFMFGVTTIIMCIMFMTSDIALSLHVKRALAGVIWLPYVVSSIWIIIKFKMFRKNHA